jgi:hypothetical protein
MLSVCLCPPSQAAIVEPEDMAVARQRLVKLYRGNGYTRNNRIIVGRGVFYVACVVSNTQYVVKGK